MMPMPDSTLFNAGFSSTACAQVVEHNKLRRRVGICFKDMIGQ
jgi:hypothetical protein